MRLERKASSVKNLADCLRAERTAAARLASAIADLERTVVARDSESMDQAVAGITREKAAVNAAMAARQLAVQRLATDVGVSDAVPCLSRLADNLPAQDRAPLIALAKEALGLHRSCSELAECSRMLLETGLEYIRFSLGAITGAVLRPVPYGMNPAAATPPTFYVDRRA